MIPQKKSLQKYETLLNNSAIYKELYAVRNFRQGFAKGLIFGGLHFGTQLLTGGAGFLRQTEFSCRTIRQPLKLSEFKKKPFKDRFKGKLEFDKVLTFDKSN